VFYGYQSLRSAESSECRVRRQVRLADVASCTEVRDIITVVATAQRSSHHLHSIWPDAQLLLCDRFEGLVRLFVCVSRTGYNSKTKKRRKIKISVKVILGRNNGLKDKISNLKDVKKPQN